MQLKLCINVCVQSILKCPSMKSRDIWHKTISVFTEIKRLLFIINSNWFWYTDWAKQNRKVFWDNARRNGCRKVLLIGRSRSHRRHIYILPQLFILDPIYFRIVIALSLRDWHIARTWRRGRGAQFVTSILIGTPRSEAPLKIDIHVLVALEAMGSDGVSANQFS
jgi:hypothetical protein